MKKGEPEDRQENLAFCRVDHLNTLRSIVPRIEGRNQVSHDEKEQTANG